MLKAGEAKRYSGGDPFGFLPKDDLKSLFDGLTEPKREQVDPNMLAFAEAVSATRRDTGFDYDTWISFF